MAKIHKVAELAGVSTATVSRALAGKSTVSPATRDKVLAAAKELGYVVSATASSLASGRTRNIGIVLPFLSGWYFTRVMAGVHGALSDAGYDMTLYHLDSTQHGPGSADPKRRRLFEEFLRRKRVDALIVVSLELSSDELSELRRIGKPIVGLGGALPGIQTLSIDDVAVAKAATEHLIALGHRAIGHIGGSERLDLDFRLPANRRVGYEQALAEAGIAVRPELTVTADFTATDGYRAAKQLLSLDDPPSAIFAASDEMAVGALLAARDAGVQVPSELSVIGIDGYELGEVFGLTTLDQQPQRQGELAVKALLAEIDSGSAPQGSQHVLLPFSLVERASTGQAK